MSKQQLPPGLRIRRGRFHYRFNLAGVEYTGSTRLPAIARNQTAALKQLAQAREAAAGGTKTARLSPKPFSDAAIAFNDWAAGEHRDHPATARRMKTSMVSLAVYFDRAPLHSITAGQIEDFKSWRRSAGIRDITIRHDLHALSQLFQYGIKQNWTSKNITEEIKIPNPDANRVHVVTPAEEAIYFTLAAGNQNLVDHARLILETGMRPEETLQLRKTDFDPRAETVRAHGKTRAATRTLRLRPAALEILRRRMLTPGPWIFGSRKTSGHVLRMNGAHDRALARYNAAKPAAPLHIVLYDFRHTFASRMAEQGCPLATLAAILGHGSLRTVGRYVHPSQQHQEDAMLRYGLSEFCPSVAPVPMVPGGSVGTGAAGGMIPSKPLNRKLSV